LADHDASRTSASDKGRPTAGAKAKQIAIPAGKKLKKDFGVPKLNGLKEAVARNRASQVTTCHFRLGGSRCQHADHTKPPLMQHPSSRANLQNAVRQDLVDESQPSTSSSNAFIAADPVDPALTIRDSSARAFTRELKKVIERSDVILQVLDARDPEGTRSRWVEEEVRKKEGEGKRLIGVVNKIGALCVYLATANIF
jgi:nuclear GTP-binding protein